MCVCVCVCVCVCGQVYSGLTQMRQESCGGKNNTGGKGCVRRDAEAMLG